MAKILKVTVNYPEEPKDMEMLQNKAMNILAKSIIKKLPPYIVKDLINKLKSDEK